MNTHFGGFEPPTTGAEAGLVVPPSFFERVVLGEPASTIRVVAFILTRTLAGQAEVEASYTELVRELRLCRQAVQEGLARAIEAGYIVQLQLGENGHVKSRYALRWAQTEAETVEPAPPPQSEKPPTTYQSEKQSAEKQTSADSIHDSKSLSNKIINLESVESSLPVRKAAQRVGGPPIALSSYLTNLSRDVSREFGDIPHQVSNRSQLLNLWHQSGLAEPAFGALVYQARDLTRTYAVLRPGEAPPAGQVRNRMPYFFTTLRNLLAEKNVPPKAKPPAPDGYAMADASPVSRPVRATPPPASKSKKGAAKIPSWQLFRGAEALRQQQQHSKPKQQEEAAKWK